MLIEAPPTGLRAAVFNVISEEDPKRTLPPILMLASSVTISALSVVVPKDASNSIFDNPAAVIC